MREIEPHRPRAIDASLAWHAAMGAGWLLAPQAWPWWLGGIAANHAVLTAAGLWPRSSLLGPNITRVPADPDGRGRVALTFDDGPNPALTPFVLEQLDAHRARASFFCVGERLQRHPQLARQIVERGHAIENHTQHHRHNFAFLGSAGLRREIEAAQRSTASVVGEVPRFFRAPAGLRNPLLQPVLASLNLRLTAWTRRGFDTVNGHADAVYGKLADALADGDILLLHDGHCARDAHGRPVLFDVLPRLLRRIDELGLRAITLREVLG
ncbi:MAG: polysaccharide deacetylase family protein [Burkholderiaceae bacterium]